MKEEFVRMLRIDPGIIKDNMRAAGYSIRSLAKKIHVDRRVIMDCFKTRRMPSELLSSIDDTVRPKTKTVWMRIGVTVPVTEDELFDMMWHAFMRDEELRALGCSEPLDHIGDYDFSDSEAEPFLRRAVADGESYIPGTCLDEYLDWFLKEKERRGV